MSSFDTMIPTGGVDGRRVVDRYDPNEHLMDLVMSRPNMQRAWKRVKTNFGAPGVDQMTVDQFEAFAKDNWDSIRSNKQFKHRLKELTGRSWFVSMEYRFDKIAEYLRGWMNYYGISEYYRPIPEIDQWLRGRVRMCYWKQWTLPRTRVKHLLKLGTDKKTAILTAISRKGPWHLSRTLATQTGMTNQWLKNQFLYLSKSCG